MSAIIVPQTALSYFLQAHTLATQVDAWVSSSAGETRKAIQEACAILVKYAHQGDGFGVVYGLRKLECAFSHHRKSSCKSAFEDRMAALFLDAEGLFYVTKIARKVVTDDRVMGAGLQVGKVERVASVTNRVGKDIVIECQRVGDQKSIKCAPAYQFLVETPYAASLRSTFTAIPVQRVAGQDQDLLAQFPQNV